MTFRHANAITMHIRLTGTVGKPRVVFANSLGSDLRIWDEVAARLHEDFELLLYDMRGHGVTDATPAPYTLPLLAADLLALLDGFGWERAAIVGLSVGGLVAQEIAIRHPDRLAGLVLMDTAARIGTAQTWNARIAAVEAGGLASISDEILSRWFTPAFREARPEAYAGWRNMLERTPVAGYIGTCAALRDADLEDELGAIRTSTLVLAGDGDLSTPPDLVRATAARIAGARFELVEGAGHLPCIERPDAVAGRIAHHLQEAGRV